jgi:hypothetical protein
MRVMEKEVEELKVIKTIVKKKSVKKDTENSIKKKVIGESEKKTLQP